MYSVVISLVAAVFIGLFSNCNKTENEIVGGDEHKMMVNMLDILTFDNSCFMRRGMLSETVLALAYWR